MNKFLDNGKFCWWSVVVVAGCPHGGRTTPYCFHEGRKNESLLFSQSWKDLNIVKVPSVGAPDWLFLSSKKNATSIWLTCPLDSRTIFDGAGTRFFQAWASLAWFLGLFSVSVAASSAFCFLRNCSRTIAGFPQFLYFLIPAGHHQRGLLFAHKKMSRSGGQELAGLQVLSPTKMKTGFALSS